MFLLLQQMVQRLQAGKWLLSSQKHPPLFLERSELLVFFAAAATNPERSLRLKIV